jgi:serine protease AprX
VLEGLRTTKCDAGQASFSALGEGIIWAVADSGVATDHAHFALHRNLEGLPGNIDHQDFTGPEVDKAPYDDVSGHGTHVAGIIAGAIPSKPSGPVLAARRERDKDGDVAYVVRDVASTGMRGMAPRAKLVSLRVLDGRDRGLTNSLLQAIEYVQDINAGGRQLKIHGLNLSVGYEFDPEWFAAGQSLLCREVDRLVRSGVVVVVAAGNTGHGHIDADVKGVVRAALSHTINDPGNADLAITVGSTHASSPHTYGISYFSSKGPTGDGRLKPDLVAPGERIVSCAAGVLRQDVRRRCASQLRDGQQVAYVERSGTSMAAPHVSGAIAGLLSIRPEFIGQPERVKALLLRSATDLGRERYFQGAGLVDQMRAIQSI